MQAALALLVLGLGAVAHGAQPVLFIDSRSQNAPYLKGGQQIRTSNIGGLVGALTGLLPPQEVPAQAQEVCAQLLAIN